MAGKKPFEEAPQQVQDDYRALVAERGPEVAMEYLEAAGYDMPENQSIGEALSGAGDYIKDDLWQDIRRDGDLQDRLGSGISKIANVLGGGRQTQVEELEEFKRLDPDYVEGGDEGGDPDMDIPDWADLHPKIVAELRLLQIDADKWERISDGARADLLVNVGETLSGGADINDAGGWQGLTQDKDHSAAVAAVEEAVGNRKLAEQLVDARSTGMADLASAERPFSFTEQQIIEDSEGGMGRMTPLGYHPKYSGQIEVNPMDPETGMSEGGLRWKAGIITEDTTYGDPGQRPEEHADFMGPVAGESKQGLAFDTGVEGVQRIFNTEKDMFRAGGGQYRSYIEDDVTRVIGNWQKFPGKIEKWYQTFVDNGVLDDSMIEDWNSPNEAFYAAVRAMFADASNKGETWQTTHKDWLAEFAAEKDEAEARAIPTLRIGLSDSETIGTAVSQTMFAMTGQRADPGWVQKMVGLWQQEERQAAQDAYQYDLAEAKRGAGTGEGGTTVEYEEAPEFSTWMEQRMWEEHPDDVRAREAVNRGINFMRMVGQEGGGML